MIISLKKPSIYIIEDLHYYAHLMYRVKTKLRILLCQNMRQAYSNMFHVCKNYS